MLVIQTLKGLCNSTGVAATIVIHQPSAEVFNCFDRLILLANGKPVFSEHLFNLPDFYERVLKVAMPQDHLVPQDLLKRATEWNDSVGLLSHTKELGAPSELVPTTNEGARDIALVGNMWKLRTLLLRNLVNHYVRNFTNLAARLVTYTIIAIFNGLVFWQVAYPGPLLREDASAAFGSYFAFSTVVFLLPFSQISTVFYDKKVFASESAMGLYPTWCFAVVQFVLELWVLCTAAVLQTSLAVPMVGLWNAAESKASSFFTNLAVFGVAGITGNSILLFSCAVSHSTDVSFSLGSAIVTVGMALSGGFVPFPKMQDWIVWLQWISALKYALQAWSIGLVRGTSAEALLEALEQDRPATVSANIGALLVFFTLCTTINIIILSRQKEVR